MAEKGNRRTIEELNLMDDFLFNEVIFDREVGTLLARLIIERATGMHLQKIVLHPQQVINGVDTDKHGIRMDVEVDELSATSVVDEVERLYDIEPQNGERVNLAKRSRYYQALRDVKLLDTGVDYDTLPEIWSIWILPYDPFGRKRMVYSVKNCVTEDPEIEYNDGIRKLFLYTNGEKGGTQSLKELLQYLKDSSSGNAAGIELQRLHSGVEKLKHKKDIKVKYMNMREFFRREVQEEVREEVREEMRSEMHEEVWKEVQEAEIKKLIFVIRKKIGKGKSVETIMDELEEENFTMISGLYHLISNFPDKTDEELSAKYLNEEI